MSGFSLGVSQIANHGRSVTLIFKSGAWIFTVLDTFPSVGHDDQVKSISRFSPHNVLSARAAALDVFQVSISEPAVSLIGKSALMVEISARFIEVCLDEHLSVPHRAGLVRRPSGRLLIGVVDLHPELLTAPPTPGDKHPVTLFLLAKQEGKSLVALVNGALDTGMVDLLIWIEVFDWRGGLLGEEVCPHVAVEIHIHALVDAPMDAVVFCVLVARVYVVFEGYRFAVDENELGVSPPAIIAHDDMASFGGHL